MTSRRGSFPCTSQRRYEFHGVSIYDSIIPRECLQIDEMIARRIIDELTRKTSMRHVARNLAREQISTARTRASDSAILRFGRIARFPPGFRQSGKLMSARGQWGDFRRISFPNCCPLRQRAREHVRVFSRYIRDRDVVANSRDCPRGCLREID